MSPWWMNVAENPGGAQFLHRVGALLVALTLLSLVWRAWRTEVRGRMGLLLAALALQVTLGISTLILVVPLPLAVAHQGGAVLLLSATLYALHGLKRMGAAA
jgi:cytochrome c oxidase assembly protein subunit 15